MPIISHVTYNCHSDLENIITKNDGTPLVGEIDMFRRIYSDCEKSEYTWHFWHNLRLSISVKKQSEIQIDFLLVCEKGVVVIEVKGGRIGVEQGIYYYESDHVRTYMERSPFDQASDYMHALMNNRIINASQLFISTVCAFPHTSMQHTNENANADEGYKLWSKILHGTENSFADFCVNILDTDKDRKGWYRPDLTKEEVEVAIKYLLFTFLERSRNVYSEKNLEAILQRLQIDNLSIFNSLQKNERLFIEGGPGTGKTTIARAYIERYHTLRGLYLCWNKLLEAKIQQELSLAGLLNCKVEQFASFIFTLNSIHNIDGISLDTISSGNAIEKLDELFIKIRENSDFLPYDYIIIDEAQDVLDKGAVQLLNTMTSISSDGISTGRYLVFYDTEQGYDSHSRKIDEIADTLALNGARFILDTNKRVPTNKEIISFAKALVEGTTVVELLQNISDANYASTQVHYFSGTRELIKYINKIKHEIREHSEKWNDFVLLADSSTKREITESKESLYDRIATLENIKELTPRNFCYDTYELPYTSILTYKGLESKHVILVINGRKEIDAYELYIGMTRAIMDIQILILQ